MSDASKSSWAAVRFWNQFSNGATPVTSYIAHCTLLPSLYQALWSFIERGGSKLLIEMGQRGSRGCKFILIPQRDVRDYSRAPSWQGKDFWQVTTLNSGGTLVFIYQIHKIFFSTFEAGFFPPKIGWQSKSSRNQCWNWALWKSVEISPIH